MESHIRDILRSVLQVGDQVLGDTPDTDPNYAFLHTIVSYARAKHESEAVMARLRDAISFEKGKPKSQVNEGEVLARFVNMLQSRFKINPQQANDLFAALKTRRRVKPSPILPPASILSEHGVTHPRVNYVIEIRPADCQARCPPSCCYPVSPLFLLRVVRRA